jgi:tetratricopeptide (TPR) repeat protein
LFLGCGLSFLLGLGSKENAVTLPIALGLIEVLCFQDLNDRRTRQICFRGLIAGGILIFVAGGLIFLNAIPLSLFKESSFRYFSPMQRLMTEPRVVVFYLSQIFYPIISRYSIEHDIAVSTSLLNPWSTLPGIVLVLMLIGIGLSQMRKRPILSFAILFFFLNHLIESSIIPLELVFEHRNYLPSLFLFLPAAVASKWLLDYYKKRNRSLAVIFGSFVAILLILLGIGTYTRNRVWLSELLLWEDAAKKAPGSSRPLHNLAWVYYERIGQYDTALNLYNQALKRQMNNTAQKSLILNNMANISFRRGDFHKAAELWEAAVIAYPKYIATKYRLALAREKSGQTQEALVLVDEILSKRPDYMDSLILKGTILLKQGQSDEALSYFKKCLNRNPFEKKAILNIGIGYNLLGRYGRAEWFFRILHHRYPQDRLLLMWLIETNLKTADQTDADRYTAKLLRLIRINELKSLRATLAAADLMSPLSRKLVLTHISKMLAERTKVISQRSL